MTNTDAHTDTTETEAAPQVAQFPEADMGGGRSGRGPSTHVPGEQQPGGLVPPYEGRREKAIEGEVGGPTEVDGLTSPKPEDTPGGATASPADEQPAAEMTQTQGDDPGIAAGDVQTKPRS